jgi:HK97 family phage prohead protease
MSSRLVLTASLPAGRPAPTGHVLRLSAPLETVDAEARTIAGLAVPYGPAGHTSMGAVTFSQGSIVLPAQLGRVKLLSEHDTDRPLGYATTAQDTPDGLRMTFSVADGPAGDEALAMAADGRRDGLSVGVALDAAAEAALIEAWLTGSTDPVPASGELLEVSQVTIPAFSDARVDGSAALAAALAQASSHVVTFSPAAAAATAPAPAGTPRGNTTMKCTKCGHVHAAGVIECEAPAVAEASSSGAQLTAAEQSSADRITAAVVAGLAAGVAAPSPPAVAAAAVGAEAPVYTFNGQGPSLVRDAWRARFEPESNPDAVERFSRFNRMMAGDARPQLERLTAAVETTTTMPSASNAEHRGEADMIRVIDRGRPMVSRIGTNPLPGGATPFYLPVEGEFTGVGDHAEGTAHVAEGDLDLGDSLVTPKAISGAYRLSRELAESSNPAVDRLAINAMARNYRRVTEAKVNTALELADPASLDATTTVAQLTAQLIAFQNADTEAADEVFMGTGFFSTLTADVDGAGRPMLSLVNPSNALGTLRPGAIGADVAGTELATAYAVDNLAAYIVSNDGVFIGESGPRNFRFEEVEGPGVIKLALWSYFVAKVVRTAGVKRLATTDETP